MNFTQFINRNVKILSGRLYSPSLKNVSWIEDAKLIFLIFHAFLYIFFPRRPFYIQMDGKLKKKINSPRSSQATSFKHGEYNFNLSILTLRFINCVKFNFGKKKLFAIGFPYKHCDFWPLCLPVKMAPKIVVKPII